MVQQRRLVERMKQFGPQIVENGTPGAWRSVWQNLRAGSGWRECKYAYVECFGKLLYLKWYVSRLLQPPHSSCHSTICQPDDSHTFGRTLGGRPAREATDRRAQREPPWRQKFKLPPLRAERRRCLALVWENYGTRPTRYSRHPGDIPVGLDPQFSMSKKITAAIPRSTPQTELRCRTPWLNYSSVFAERNFIATISSATTTTP